MTPSDHYWSFIPFSCIKTHFHTHSLTNASTSKREVEQSICKGSTLDHIGHWLGCNVVKTPLCDRQLKNGLTMSQFALQWQMRFIKRLKCRQRFCCGQHGEACRLCMAAS